MAYSTDSTESSFIFNTDLHIHVYNDKQNVSLKRKLPMYLVHYNEAMAPTKHIAQLGLCQSLLMNGQVLSLDVWEKRQLAVHSSGASEEDNDGSLAGNQTFKAYQNLTQDLTNAMLCYLRMEKK